MSKFDSCCIPNGIIFSSFELRAYSKQFSGKNVLKCIQNIEHYRKYNILVFWCVQFENLALKIKIFAYWRIYLQNQDFFKY